MEKRVDRRVKKRLLVKFGEKEPVHVGFTEDLSQTGLFLKSTKVFRPGTTLTLTMGLHDRRVISMKGHVMWAKRVPPSMVRFARKHGMGIMFVEVDEEYKKFFFALMH